MKVCFIFRKHADTPSIERVFAAVGKEFEKRGIEVVVSRLPFGNGAIGALLNLIFYRPPDADLLHITGHVHYISLKLPVRRTVLTVHDAGILRRRSGIRLIAIKKLYFEWPFKRLKLITTISEATRLELIEKTDCPPEKLIVIADLIVADIIGRKSFNSKQPNILFVGTAPHKNLDRSISAVRGLSCRLIIIGKLGRITREIMVRENIAFENIESASDSEMAEAYGNADLLSFCSTFEGFGMPIIEAQAVGLPVVTSNIPPMSEVAGDGAMFVDPFDVASIRAGIRAVIDDAMSRERIIAAGYKNVQRFAPDRIANDYLDAYNKVLSEAG
jgi:glycosyltransferase involved in cell wall biosynthesis